jgi:integrase/recombinase XerD
MQELTVTQAFDVAEVQLIEQWLHGRPETTRIAYLKDIERLYKFIAPRGLRSLTLLDLQLYDDSLADMATASRARRLNAAKSLISFMHRIGYLPVNVGAALKAPHVDDQLSQRLLTEEQVLLMIGMERNKRNHIILRLLYSAALRVSELCSLTWRDVQPNRAGGQVSVIGKGNKRRSVPVSIATYEELLSLKPIGAGPDTPVFVSEGRVRGQPLSRIQIWRLVKTAAKRAGIPPETSTHWLRHAHASHAIDRNAPLPLVRDTLGHANVSTTSKYLHARPNDSSSYYLPL